MLALGDRAGAQAQVRDAWRNDAFGADLEAQVLEAFGGLLTAADHKARMDMRLYAEDTEGGLRNANRAGGDAPAIAKARIAVIKKAGNAKAALDAVPAVGAPRPRLHLQPGAVAAPRRQAAEAGDLILSAPRDPSQSIDTDQWWIERRLAARNMLDLGDAAKAYRIARDAAVPKRDNYRAEHQFTAGWIALRFLNDPATALTHFARIAEGNPIRSRWRARGYWLGRALEAQGRNQRGARALPGGRAASHRLLRTARRARKLGLQQHRAALAAAAPPATLEVVRAMELLYAVGQRDMVAGAVADLGDRLTDAAALAAIGEVAAPQQRCPRHAAARQGGARARTAARATTRSRPSACRTTPRSARRWSKALVYAIARQESTFNQKTVSSAHAMGLMQVTPAAGKYIAKKFNVTYNEKKLLSDPVYNVQLGAAELGDLLADFRGSYILDLRRLQRRPRPHPRLGRALRRPARPEGRSGRLGRAHPVLRDAQLRPARDGEHAGLSHPLRRRRQADDRGRPAPRRRAVADLLPTLSLARLRYGPPKSSGWRSWPPRATSNSG